MHNTFITYTIIPVIICSQLVVKHQWNGLLFCEPQQMFYGIRDNDEVIMGFCLKTFFNCPCPRKFIRLLYTYTIYRKTLRIECRRV